MYIFRHGRIHKGDRGSGPPLKIHKNIMFLSNTGPDSLKSHKDTKPAFNIGPSLANILTTLQSETTGNQRVDIFYTFCHSVDQGQEIRAVFCGISKAFDRGWHRGHLYNLESAWISGSLLSWFKSNVLFMEHMQTVQTQTRRHRMQHLLRVSTICLQNVL